MNAYLDSSVLLRLILGEPGRLTGWQAYDRLVCSDLVEVECLRSLDRLRLKHALSEEEVIVRREALFQVLEAIVVVELTRPILRRASDAFPVAVGTLDAIHLATAIAWQDDQGSTLVMATHDRVLGQAARAFGMVAVGI